MLRKWGIFLMRITTALKVCGAMVFIYFWAGIRSEFVWINVVNEMVVLYTKVRRARVWAWKEKEDDPKSMHELREVLKLQKKMS